MIDQDENIKTPENDKGKAHSESSIMKEGIDENKLAEIEANPDIEDPRLYSPLQEPDRPDPSERKKEQEESKPHSEEPDEKQESPPANE